MGRKVFQDFANVLCKKFVESPTNRDLVNLTILGDGILELAITDQRATHRGHAVEPFPFEKQALDWLDSRLDELKIPRTELQRAVLKVDYTIKLHRRQDSLGWLCVDLTLTCEAAVRAPDREYHSTLSAKKSWGLYMV